MSELYWKAQAGRWKRAFWSLYNDGIDSEKRAKINARNKELAKARRKAKKNLSPKKTSAPKSKPAKKSQKKAVGGQMTFF